MVISFPNIPDPFKSISLIKSPPLYSISFGLLSMPDSAPGRIKKQGLCEREPVMTDIVLMQGGDWTGVWDLEDWVHAKVFKE